MLSCILILCKHGVKATYYESEDCGESSLTSREAERIRLAGLVLRESSSVDDFAQNLGVRDYGLDTWKDLGADVGIENDTIVPYFRRRGDQGWKVDSNYSSAEDIMDCRRHYELVYIWRSPIKWFLPGHIFKGVAC